jgi:hypothetical protein
MFSKSAIKGNKVKRITAAVKVDILLTEQLISRWIIHMCISRCNLFSIYSLKKQPITNKNFTVADESRKGYQ